MKLLPAVLASLLLTACHSMTIKTMPAADGLPAQRCVHEKVKFVFKFVDVLKCTPIEQAAATTRGVDKAQP